MIKIEKVCKTYNIGKRNEFQALKTISTIISDGEMVGIMGTSGSGKSTLIHLIACIDDFEKGEIYINSNAISSMSEKAKSKIRNKEIGFVFQDFALIEDASVYDNIELPLLLCNKHIKNKKELVLNALNNVGMPDFINRPISELSGGQKQRVAVARAIVNDPAIILADEPTGALDSKTAADIMGLFKKLNNDGKTVIIVTHDKEIAAQCGRIIEISDGRII